MPFGCIGDGLLLATLHDYSCWMTVPQIPPDNPDIIIPVSVINATNGYIFSDIDGKYPTLYIVVDEPINISAFEHCTISDREIDIWFLSLIVGGEDRIQLEDVHLIELIQWIRHNATKITFLYIHTWNCYLSDVDKIISQEDVMEINFNTNTQFTTELAGNQFVTELQKWKPKDEYHMMTVTFHKTKIPPEQISAIKSCESKNLKIECDV